MGSQQLCRRPRQRASGHQRGECMARRVDSRLLIAVTVLSLVGCAAPATPARGVERPAEVTAPAAQSVGAPASGAPPSETAVPAARAIQVPLSAVSGSVTPVWVAAQAGLFRQHGLDAELVTVSPATAVQAMLAGSAPITASGSGTVTAWLSGATDLVFVGGGVNRAVFKVMSRPDVTTVQELRGKTLGNTAPTSSGTLSMFETLRRFGLEVDRDYTMTYLREQSAVLAALLSNAIQGTVLGTPLSEEAEAQGMRLLVDQRDLDIQMMSSYVTTTRQIVAREPELVQR